MLIERDHELSCIIERAQTLRTGGVCLLLHGEPGIGKTSLLRAAISRLPPGIDWLWSSCEPMLSAPPLGALIDLIDRLPPSLAMAVRNGRATQDVLAGMLSLLRDRAAPIVVVIDDVQWADGATLDLLRYLGRRIEHTQAMLALVYRDDALAGDHPLRDLLGSLPPRHTLRLALAPLSPAGVSELARQAGRDAAGLHRVTQGNPFFVTEALASSGDVLPLAVQDAVLARAARLSRGGRELLELVSLSPTELEREIVDAVLDDAAPVIDECLGAGLLLLEGRAEGRAEGQTLRFRHELARRSIEAACPQLRAAALHHALLDALSLRGASAARQVHHAQHAGLPAAVLRLAPLAAYEAAQAGAHREAAVLLELALLHSVGLNAKDHAALWVACSVSKAAIGQLDSALHARQQALALHRDVGDLRAQGLDLREIARMCWMGGALADAAQHAVQAVSLLGQAGSPRELALAQATLAQVHMLDEQLDATIAWGREALATFSQLQDAEGLAYVLNTVGSAELIGGPTPAGWAMVERSLAIACAHELDEHASRAFLNLASLTLVHRRLDAAQDWCSQGIAWAEARDHDLYVACLRIRAARCDVECGRWALARAQLQWVQNAPKLAPIEREQSALLLGLLDVRQGLPVAALPVGPGVDPWYAPRAVAAAETAWLQGRPEVAAQIARDDLPGALRRGERWRTGQLACWLQRTGGGDALPALLAGVTLTDPCALELAGEHAGAAAAWAALGCPYEQALALLSGGINELQQAVALLDTLGALPAAAIARRRLRSVGVRVGTRGPNRGARSDPLGLTPRERTMLEALRQGLSNKAIASRLHRSERTVEAHVSALLGKLGVSHREQAVARAAAVEGDKK